jgi:LmbE family N-acetylglucosaminyl deacetylase
MSDRSTSLYVLAHQDDEYGCAPQIARDAAAGRRAVVVYLTDGSTPLVAEMVRTAESRAVLGALGVALDDVRVIGATLGIGSEALPERLEHAYAALLELARALGPARPLRIYAPAWEGGHPDHDATHLAAARLARELGVSEIYEIALYNGYRRRGPFYRVLSFCDGAHVGDAAGPRLSMAEVVRYGLLCWHYPSQRRTWAGLFGGAFARLALRRRHAIRRVPSNRSRSRPHPGSLYYERRWGLSYERFAELVDGF